MKQIVQSCYDHRGRIVTVTMQKDIGSMHEDKAFEGVDFVVLEKKDAQALMDFMNALERERCERNPDYNIQEAHGEDFGLAHGRLVDRLDGLIYSSKDPGCR